MIIAGILNQFHAFLNNLPAMQMKLNIAENDYEYEQKHFSSLLFSHYKFSSVNTTVRRRLYKQMLFLSINSYKIYVLQTVTTKRSTMIRICLYDASHCMALTQSGL